MKKIPTLIALSFLSATLGKASPAAGPAGVSGSMQNGAGTARAAALGGAVEAYGGETGAALWNPAGLGTLAGSELAVHHQSWLVGTLQESCLAGLPLGKWGGMAMAANYVSFGSFDARDDSGVVTGGFGASRLGVGLAWGRQWGKGLALGASARWMQQNVADESDGAWSGSLGLLWSGLPRLSVGLAFDNLGPGYADEGQNGLLRLGAATHFEPGRDIRLNLSAGGSVEPRSVSRVHAGAEISFNRSLALRAGYQAPLASDQWEGRQGFSLGAGLSLARFDLDYAVTPYGDLGTSQRFSLTCHFDAAPPSANKL